MLKLYMVVKQATTKKPTIMRMQIHDGNNATTYTENASVLGPHFAKVFCTDRTVDWPALNEVRQRDAMQ